MDIHDFFQNFLKTFLVCFHGAFTSSVIAPDMPPPLPYRSRAVELHTRHLFSNLQAARSRHRPQPHSAPGPSAGVVPDGGRSPPNGGRAGYRLPAPPLCACATRRPARLPLVLLLYSYSFRITIFWLASFDSLNLAPVYDLASSVHRYVVL